MARTNDARIPLDSSDKRPTVTSTTRPVVDHRTTGRFRWHWPAPNARTPRQSVALVYGNSAMYRARLIAWAIIRC